MNDAWDGAEAFLRPEQEQSIATTDARRSTMRGGYVVSYGLTTSDQGGLPLTMRDGVPVEPDASAGRAIQLRLKRLIDLLLAAVGLMVLSPLLIGVALTIRATSKGPALFRQNRVGLNGRTFRMLQFRTVSIADAAGQQRAADVDRRSTRVGMWLQATGIDELPQLWNVLVGDMALVGPRPMVPGMLAAGVDRRDVVPYHDYRHRMRPGLSGWAQANGLRGPSGDATSARQRIDHDCAYVQNFSLGLDARIIVRTILRESLTGSGL